MISPNTLHLWTSPQLCEVWKVYGVGWQGHLSSRYMQPRLAQNTTLPYSVSLSSLGLRPAAGEIFHSLFPRPLAHLLSQGSSLLLAWGLHRLRSLSPASHPGLSLNHTAFLGVA